jgi:NAD(P)-dependent dehydrogenase (short-subunit alcohol dehydrogenase family)
MAGTDTATPFAEPEEIARLIRFLVSEEAKHLTGAELPADDGWSL